MTTFKARPPKPWIRLDKVEVKPLVKEKGCEVVIHGFNLKGGAVVPRVTVGGLPVRVTSLGRGGRELRGRLSREPESHDVVVDYGFARAELRD